jgi:uncharacterized protein (TIGR02145 family)
MKETGFAHWSSPNTGATDESGFAALGAGIRWSDGNCYSLQEEAFIWSSSELNTSHAWYRYLANSYENIIRTNHVKIYGMSVRCVKD